MNWFKSKTYGNMDDGDSSQRLNPFGPPPVVARNGNGGRVAGNAGFNRHAVPLTNTLVVRCTVCGACYQKHIDCGHFMCESCGAYVTHAPQVPHQVQQPTHVTVVVEHRGGSSDKRRSKSKKEKQRKKERRRRSASSSSTSDTASSGSSSSDSRSRRRDKARIRVLKKQLRELKAPNDSSQQTFQQQGLDLLQRHAEMNKRELHRRLDQLQQQLSSMNVTETSGASASSASMGDNYDQAIRPSSNGQPRGQAAMAEPRGQAALADVATHQWPATWTCSTSAAQSGWDLPQLTDQDSKLVDQTALSAWPSEHSSGSAQIPSAIADWPAPAVWPPQSSSTVMPASSPSSVWQGQGTAWNSAAICDTNPFEAGCVQAAPKSGNFQMDSLQGAWGQPMTSNDGRGSTASNPFSKEQFAKVMNVPPFVADLSSDQLLMLAQAKRFQEQCSQEPSRQAQPQPQLQIQYMDSKNAWSP